MEDLCYEQLVADTRRARTVWLRIGMAALVALVLFLELLFWQIGRYCFVLTLFLATVFILFFWRRVDREYEYIFTDGQLDVDVIFSKRGRKHLVSVDCRHIKLMAPADDPRYQRSFELPATQSLYAADGRREGEGLYCLLAASGERSLKLIFQPDGQLYRLIKRYAPRAVDPAGVLKKTNN